MAEDRYMKPGRFGRTPDVRKTNSMKIDKLFKRAVNSGEFGGTRDEFVKIQKNLSRFDRGTLAVDNPLLSRESAQKAMDAASREMESPAIRKARVKPTRRGA